MDSRQPQGVETARRNLPIFSEPEAREHFVQELAQVIVERLAESAVQQYFDWSASLTGRGLPVAFPEAARDLPIQPQTPLVLTDSKRLIFEEVAGQQIAFWAAGKFWRAEAAFKPGLTCLDDEQGHSSEALSAKVAPDSRARFGLFLTGLVESGVLAPYPATFGRSAEVISGATV